MWWIDRHTERRNNNIVCSINTNTNANANVSMHAYTHTHPIPVAMCACIMCAVVVMDVRVYAIVLHMIFSHTGHSVVPTIDIYHRANTHTHANRCVCFKRQRNTTAATHPQNVIYREQQTYESIFCLLHSFDCAMNEVVDRWFGWWKSINNT